MSQTYFAILTAVGEAKIANATALGTQLQISKMAVGDGNGSLPTPNRNQTALANERYRASLNNLSVDPKNASQVTAEMIIPEAEGGYWLREIALFDATGDMVAVSNCPPSYKPQMAEGSGRTQVLRMVLVVSSSEAVQLKIDPSVVLATREYVETTIIAALNKQDYKHSVLVATTTATVLSGVQSIDGVAVTAGARVLVKDQAQAKDNGIWVVAAAAWSRATDADVSEEVTPGLFVHVERGVIGGDSVWQLVTDAPITLGTTPLAFEMLAGRTGVAAGTYTKLTVDKYGRVIGGTAPTTLAGLGIQDAYTKVQVDSLVAEAAATLPRDYQTGLIMSMNATAPGTTVEFSAGGARGAGNSVWASTPIACILQSAGAWTAGNNGNKLDTGSRTANTWYHSYLIRRNDSGDRDILFSTGAALQVPAGYELIARLKGRAVKTDSAGNIIPFINFGKSTDFKALQRDMRLTGGVSRSTTVTVSAPPGASVLTRHYAAIVAENGMILIRHPEADDTVLGPISNNITNTYAGGIGQGNTGLNSENASGYCSARTNVSGQVVAQVYVGGGYNVIEAWLYTQGWTEE